MATQQQSLRTHGQERALPISRDIIYTAMKQYPGYDQQTALALYLIDQNAQQQKTDAEQTNLIQSQKRQNEKLVSAVKNIGQEIDELERQSIEADNEINRIRDLSGTLKTAGDVRQKDTKATADELKDVEKQLDQIKKQSGINPTQYKELLNQVNELKSKAPDPADVHKIQKILTTLQGTQGATTDAYKKVMNQLQRTQAELDAKEDRFKGYIRRQGETTRTYGKEIEALKPKIAAANQATQQILDMRDQIKRELESLRDEEAQLDVKRGATAADVARQALIKARTNPTKARTNPPQIAQDLPTNIERQAEVDRRHTMAANPEKYISEEVRLAHDYPGSPDYARWLTTNLPIILNMFKNRYWNELEKKHPTYPDSQIAYIIEDFAPWLWNHESDVLTQEIMDKFLRAVKSELWKQPPEPEQSEFSFLEGLDKIYESMLDQIINETLSKPR